MSRLSCFAKTFLISSITACSTLFSMGLQALALEYNPPNRGAPPNTRDAGRREGFCGDLTAVQPAGTNWGATLLERPTFGLYVAEPAKNLTFTLKDESSDEVLYTAELGDLEGPGISLYTLPDDAPALELDQWYRWEVSLECEQFETELTPNQSIKQVGGVIVRQADDELQTALANTTAAERPNLLAINGIWYDAVHTLMVQWMQQPDSETWQNAWQTLIEHPAVLLLEDLQDTMPIISCQIADVPIAIPSDVQ